MLSASQINLFLQCPLSWYYRYVAKISKFVDTPATIFGKNVHGAISTGTFKSEIPEEQACIEAARAILNDYEYNDTLLFETDYKDPYNPGKVKGKCFNVGFQGFCDVVSPARGLIIDWKTGGKHDPRYVQSHEVQAYVLGELFAQTHHRKVYAVDFHFLKLGKTYRAKSVYPGTARDKIERLISEAVEGIQAKDCEPKTGPLCPYCEFYGTEKCGAV